MTDFIDLDAITARLHEVVLRSGLSHKEFALRADINAPTLSQYLNKKNVINVASINKVIAHFPELVAPHWFLFGEEGERPSSSQGSDAASEVPADLTALQQILRSQAEEIAELQAELEKLRKREIAHINVYYSDNSFSSFTEKG